MERVQARRERQTIQAQVQPMVERLFVELGVANKVVERVEIRRAPSGGKLPDRN